MSLFDLAAGLLLGVSALVGWFRGATREVTTAAALLIAAGGAMFTLRYSGPVARHAIHTPWLANLVAILIVFTAVYVVLRVAAAAMTRRIHQTRGLGEVDRAIGAGFGVVRALVVLGLAYLTLNAVTPADRMPTWITGAMLYPVSAASAQTLKAFAPQGSRLARQVEPIVGQAINGGSANRTDGADQTSDDAPPPRTTP